MEKTVKVKTVIGVIVEMPESIYEANKNIYTLVEVEKPAENIKTEPSKTEIVAKLKELNVEFKSNANKDILQTLLDETLAKIESEKPAETPETEVQTTDLKPEENTAETNITNTAM